MAAGPLESNSRILFRISKPHEEQSAGYFRPTATSVDSGFQGLLTELEQITYLQDGGSDIAYLYDNQSLDKNEVVGNSWTRG